MLPFIARVVELLAIYRPIGYSIGSIKKAEYSRNS